MAETNTGKPWSEPDLDYLMRELRRNTPLLEVAEYLKRDVVEVETKADTFEIPEVSLSRLLLQYVQDPAIDPDVSKLLADAFVQALDVLGDIPAAGGLISMGNRIKAAAQKGERDMYLLRDSALEGMVLHLRQLRRKNKR